MNPPFDEDNPQPHYTQPLAPSPEPPLPSPQSPAPNGPGRPRALDEIRRREVCALVSAGCGVERAARYVGCAASTIRREALRNPQFNEQLRQAHLAAELAPLQAVRRAAERYWRAGAWFMERTNPQRFAKQNVVLLKPEQLKEAFDAFATMLMEEARDPALRRRLRRRLKKFSREMEQETWATHLDPFPRPRKARKRVRPPEPFPPPAQDELTDDPVVRGSHDPAPHDPDDPQAQS